MEPYLRNKLRMPTELKDGVVHLLKEFNVCKEGVALTPEAAKILVSESITQILTAFAGIDGHQVIFVQDLPHMCVESARQVQDAQQGMKEALIVHSLSQYHPKPWQMIVRNGSGIPITSTMPGTISRFLPL